MDKIRKIKVDVSEVIIVPEKLAVFPDKKTGVKTVAFPITFATGVNGIVSVTHLSTMPWKPSDDIESIEIKFKPL